jgi:hypothetical protein
MSKIIKVSDETYGKLKCMADKEYRTLGSQIDFLIEGGGYSSLRPPVEETSSENIPKKISVNAPRDKEILAEINALEADINNADTFNQDPDYWDKINEKKAYVAELWAEWHEVTGQ